jgi:hypothetical protein
MDSIIMVYTFGAYARSRTPLLFRHYNKVNLRLLFCVYYLVRVAGRETNESCAWETEFARILWRGVLGRDI